MTITATATGVRCGNHGAERVYHDTLESVRACFREAQHTAYAGRVSGKVEAREPDLSAFDTTPTVIPRPEIYLQDVVDGNATIGEYLEARTDLSPEQKAKALARIEAPARKGYAVDSDGMYRNPETGKIFKVYYTVHGRGVLVAKELVLLDESQWYTKTVRRKEVLVKAEFVYRGLAGLRELTADMKMTLEEGKKYGAIYGVCVRCSATLTNEESIERAMGPVCAGKENWA